MIVLDTLYGTFSVFPTSLDSVINQYLPNSLNGLRGQIQKYDIEFSAGDVGTVSEAVIVLAHLRERQAPRTTP